MSRFAVVLVDLLNDFVTGELGTKRAEVIIVPLQRLVEAAHVRGVPVIFSNDAHYVHDVEVTQKWGPHAMKGTSGAEVISELAPDLTRDFIVEKHAYSGFYETGLDSLLRSLYKGKGVDTIIFGGLHTHLCVRHTVADAFFRGYHLIAARDGTEAFTEEDHRQGLEYLKNVYGTTVLTVDKIIEKLDHSAT
jgi:nicotinamidase-related amidase